MDPSQIQMMLGYVDIFQVGARNMQNYHLLRALGEVRKPVLLKRGMSATMEELLLSAEYILAGGNYNVILCERGIRTFETYTRNTFDIAAIPVIKKLSHLPMFGDPSHGTGRRDKVPPMARAAVAAGADGLLIEVHNDPDHALSDGAQSLDPKQFAQLMTELRIIAPAIGRRIGSIHIAFFMTLSSHQPRGDSRDRIDRRIVRAGLTQVRYGTCTSRAGIDRTCWMRRSDSGAFDEVFSGDAAAAALRDADLVLIALADRGHDRPAAGDRATRVHETRWSPMPAARNCASSAPRRNCSNEKTCRCFLAGIPWLAGKWPASQTLMRICFAAPLTH